MAAAHWVKTLLEERGVAFTETHHQLAFTAQEVAQQEHVTGHRLAKVVIVLVQGQPVELVLPASRRVVLDRVQQMTGTSQVRLASEAEMDRVFTDVETGAIPALRHWKDVDVIMDETMKVDGKIILQGGTHEDTVELDFHDWYNLVSPRVGAFTELENQTGNRMFSDRDDPGAGA
jgi:Ala-tRNA(Pro) deacylase